MTLTEAWLAPELNRDEFMAAFRAEFPTGKIEYLPMPADAHPVQVPDGQQFFQMEVPSERKAEYEKFFNDYAAAHGYAPTRFPSSSGFGFSHNG